MMRLEFIGMWRGDSVLTAAGVGSVLNLTGSFAVTTATGVFASLTVTWASGWIGSGIGMIDGGDCDFGELPWAPFFSYF